MMVFTTWRIAMITHDLELPVAAFKVSGPAVTRLNDRREPRTLIRETKLENGGGGIEKTSLQACKKTGADLALAREQYT